MAMEQWERKLRIIIISKYSKVIPFLNGKDMP